jgi:predicted HTH domain antitoxin
MYATNVRELKKNPSRALREAEHAPVLILKGSVPHAVLLHLERSLAETEGALRPALAAALYRDGVLSLGAAANLSGMVLGDFVSHLGALGIDIVRPDETTAKESADLSTWLSS